MDIAWVGRLGAPRESLEELQQQLKPTPAAKAVFITDWQGKREQARYAFLLEQGGQAQLAPPTFGPRYGEAGAQALRELVSWLEQQGVTNFKETVISPYDFQRLVWAAGPAQIQALLAAANPTDPAIYREVLHTPSPA